MSKTITAPDAAKSAASCKRLIPHLRDLVSIAADIDAALGTSIASKGNLPPYTPAYPGGRGLRTARTLATRSLDDAKAALASAEAGELVKAIEAFNLSAAASDAAKRIWTEAEANPLPAL